MSTTMVAPAWTQEDLLGVFDRSPEAWRVQAERVVRRFAESMRPFTTDDLRDSGLDEPGDGVHNRWGAMMSAMAALHVVRQTGGFPRSRRPEANGRRIAEWIGVTR